MLKISSGLMLAFALSLSGASPGLALPMATPQTNAGSLLQESRVFCYNRYSGQFLHWGGCAPVYYHPRVYCRNSYTGRFLHWGSCW